jgi:hypothetical protein
MGTYSIPVYRIAEQLQVFYPEVKFFDMEYDNPESAFLCELAGAGAPLQLPLIFYYQNGLMIHHTAGNQSSEQIKGIARQYIEDDGQKSHNLRIIQPGEFVGLSSVFTSKRFDYSSVAITDCQVFLIENEAINQVCNQNGEFAMSISKRYFEQNVNLYDKLRKLLYKQMNGRMAETLLYLDSLRNEHSDLFQLLIAWFF